MKSFVAFLELIRFSHTLFALPFAFLAAGMALKLNLLETPPKMPRLFDLLGILLCMVFARSAAMAFNRWADRDVDAANPRTASRHLPGGRISEKSVILFTALSSLGFIAATLLFLPNTLPLFASVPVLLFLFSYSYTKRWTVAAHFWLGAALMLAPMAAWVVIRPPAWPFFTSADWPWPPFFLGLAVLFWTAGFDLIYACQDAQFDADTKLFSIPGRYGIHAAFRLAAACHSLAVLFFAAVAFVFAPFQMIYCTGVLLVAVILLAEHYFARPRKDKPLDLDKINIAFFQMNALVSLLLLGFGTVDLIF